MTKLALLLIGCTLLLTSCQFFDRADAQGQPGFASEKTKTEDDPLVMGLPRRQLTQIGPRSGEAYFSPDGQKLIFQSERFSGNPFYQIYSLDLQTGKTDLLSSGKGKTTCAWFHPSMNKALFSSTHLDADFGKKVLEEESSRKNPQKNKYTWSFDDTFDIFEVDLQSKKSKQLTKAKGYDAEGSYSPDGKWILFASNRGAYTDKLSEDEQKLFSQDPSSQMEIYIMKADGSDVKRLTNHLGYDGGPFFSADGSKITWRRFNKTGSTAEIWTMSIDGSEQKEITHLSAMSWAPFFHPSGDYIVFTSNKLGYSNFELFIVDTQGAKEPIRVSYWDGFDGLPVFSPDGKKIVWTHKDEKGESQIYSADWDDFKARQLLGLKIPAPTLTKGDIRSQSESDAKSIVRYLASDERGGRLTGSKEEPKMSEELGKMMQEIGLESYNQKSMVHPFDFTSGVDLGAKNHLKLQMQDQVVDLKLNDDFLPLSFSKNGDFDFSKIAFAGYGLVAAANESQPEYNSYKDLDVKGKWVLVFREIPEEISNPRRIFLNQVSRLHHKALVAKQAGAVGLLIVTGPKSTSNQKVMKLRFDGSFAEAGIPVISVSDQVAEKILKNTGKSLETWQNSLDRGETLGISELLESKISASIDLIEKKSTGHNILGQIKVPGAKTTLVIGAHGDHLGLGESGSSLARGLDIGKIHPGADDNASGVAALFLVARQMKKLISEKKFLPKQNILFAIWSGEELGLLGSNAFLKDQKGPFSSYLNMDMVGRLRETLMVQGAGSATEWRQIIEPLAIQQKISISVQNDPYLPSDSMSFYLKQIPTVMLFTGVHTEYHTPQDTWEKINFPGIVQVANFMTGLGQSLAENKSKLTYQKVESSHQKLEGRSFRIYIGTIPDYAQEKVKGVLISGTSKESPAEKAGLLPGDIIRGVAGTKIDNIYDYVYVLQALKPNQKIKIEVLRKDQTLNLDLTPMLKE